MPIITSDVAGTVWKLLVSVGDSLEPGEMVAILESMKMEIPVESPCAGVVIVLEVAEGDVIQEGDHIAVVEPGS